MPSRRPAAGNGGTLAEDLDLSYRCWRRGRRGRFLLTVAVPGELPETMKAWMTQQRRWTKGFGQVTLRMIGPILRDRRLTPRQRLPPCSISASGGRGRPGRWPCRSASPRSSPIRRCSGPSAPSCSRQLLIGYAALFVFLRAGNLSLRPGKLGLRHFLRRFLRISHHLFTIGASIGKAQREVVFGMRSEFVRTPKTAVLASRAAEPARGEAEVRGLARK